MSGTLEGKVVVVTGSTRSIGKAVAVAAGRTPALRFPLWQAGPAG